MDKKTVLAILGCAILADAQLVWKSTMGMQVKKPDGTTQGDYWYKYGDNVGSTATVAPANFGPTANLTTPIVLTYTLGATQITPASGYPYNPYAGAGFSWAPTPATGPAPTVSLTAKGSLCLTYSSTADLTLSLKGTTNADYTLPAAATKTSVNVTWAQFGTNGAAAAAANSKVQWQFQAAPSSTNTFSLYEVGFGPAACGVTATSSSSTTPSSSSVAASSSSSVVTSTTAGPGVIWLPSYGSQGKLLDGTTAGGYWYGFNDKGSRTACLTASNCTAASLDTTPSFTNPSIAGFGPGITASALANSNAFVQVTMTTGTPIPYLPYSWASYVGFGLNLKEPPAPIDISSKGGVCITYSASRPTKMSISSTIQADVTLPASVGLTTVEIPWSAWDTVAAKPANALTGDTAKPAAYPIRAAILAAKDIKFQYGGAPNTTDTVHLASLAIFNIGTTATLPTANAFRTGEELRIENGVVRFSGVATSVTTLDAFDLNGKHLATLYRGTSTSLQSVALHLPGFQGVGIIRLDSGSKVRATKTVIFR